MLWAVALGLWKEGHAMLKYFVKRVLQGLVTLLVLSFVIYFAARLIAGSQSIRMRGYGQTTQGYFSFLANALRGDLGMSATFPRPVMSEIQGRYGYTMILAVGGTTVSVVLGVLLGIVAAVRRDSRLDKVIMVMSLTTVSIPLFFSALILMLVFCLYLGWLPSLGLESWQGFILPIVTLGLPAIGFFTRTARSAMLDALGEDYIRTSRARGLPEKLIIYSHAFRNTLVPVLTAVGVRFGELLAGTVLVENAFSIPGLGRLIVSAVVQRDYNLLQGAVLVLAGTFLVINIVIDLLYALVDPKMRLS